MESSRTSLVSNTSSRAHFEVLGLDLEGQVLGLEASSPRKLACLRLEDSTIFRIVKILWSAWKIFWKTFFVKSTWKIFVKTFFFRRALALVSLVLGHGLEHSCPWPQECLSSEGLSLASDFFCVLGLGLEPYVLDSTSVSEDNLSFWVISLTEWNNSSCVETIVSITIHGYTQPPFLVKYSNLPFHPKWSIY